MSSNQEVQTIKQRLRAEYLNKLDSVIAGLIISKPETRLVEIAAEVGVSLAWVRRVNTERECGRKPGNGSSSHPSQRNQGDRS